MFSVACRSKYCCPQSLSLYLSPSAVRQPLSPCLPVGRLSAGPFFRRNPLLSQYLVSWQLFRMFSVAIALWSPYSLVCQRPSSAPIRGSFAHSFCAALQHGGPSPLYKSSHILSPLSHSFHNVPQRSVSFHHSHTRHPDSRVRHPCSQQAPELHWKPPEPSLILLSPNLPERCVPQCHPMTVPQTLKASLNTQSVPYITRQC